MILEFLYVLGVDGFATRGIQLILWMNSLRRCVVVFLCVFGVSGFASREI